MMSKKQRGGLHYDMNKGTNFRGGDEKVDKLLVIVLPLKRVKLFVGVQVSDAAGDFGTTFAAFHSCV